MTEADFIKKYTDLISEIADIIEKNDIEANFDIDLSSDILTIKGDMGTYVINKQGSIKEIWLSSPVSGPYHFAYKEGVWRSNSGVDFLSLLSTEFGYNFNI